MKARSVILILLVSGCSVEPQLTFDPGTTPLIVGQHASIVVTSGGDGSSLLDQTLSLVDAGNNTYSGKALEVSRVSDSEVKFSIPPGIIPGAAKLSVQTSRGEAYVFDGQININRVIPMRDLGGRIWLPSITSSSGDVTPAVSSIKAGVLGYGRGKVAVGFKGRLLASSAYVAHQIWLTWLVSKNPVATSHTFDATTNIADLAVTPKGHTLVCTNNGVYVINMPDEKMANTLQVSSSPIVAAPCVALALGSKGGRALIVNGPTTTATSFSFTLLDLYSDTPTKLYTKNLPWTTASTKYISAAASPDASTILVADGNSNKLLVVVQGTTGSTELDFPAGEDGAVDLISNKDGTTFYAANKTSINLSVIKNASGVVTFGTPIPLGVSAPSGAPVGLAVSSSDEIIVLLQHDMILLYNNGTQAKQLKFNSLFTDKTTGAEGGGIAIQP